jgi:hypothetical protein
LFRGRNFLDSLVIFMASLRNIRRFSVQSAQALSPKVHQKLYTRLRASLCSGVNMGLVSASGEMLMGAFPVYVVFPACLYCAENLVFVFAWLLH